MLAEIIQVTRPLSHFSIRPLPPKQNTKQNRMKVGSMGTQSGLFISSKENPCSDACFHSKAGVSSAQRQLESVRPTHSLEAFG